MVASAAELIRRHGASATTIDRVLADSEAPRGSVYHHFPGGRAQLVAEAVAYASVHGAAPLPGTVPTPPGDGPNPALPDPLAVLDGIVETWRRRLTASDFRAGCTVLAVAVEGDGQLPEAYAAAGEALTTWRTRLTDLLVGHGAPASEATNLATLAVASIEGAIILCRTDASLVPLETTATYLHDLFAAALERAR